MGPAGQTIARGKMKVIRLTSHPEITPRFQLRVHSSGTSKESNAISWNGASLNGEKDKKSVGNPLKDSPILLFCPGIVGVGLALTLHHKALGKVFEVRCLHIPVNDRTPFEGLVKFVEETVRLEHASSPNKPIYLVGDSFGGCLALAVAARNPEIDLVVILANPATSFDRSQLRPLFPLWEVLPDELYDAIPYLLRFARGNPVEMARVNIADRLPPRLQIEQLFQNLIALLPHLSDSVDTIPKDTLIWKLKLLRSAASYANSRLHAVKAEVLVLSSGNDRLLPSGDEAQRLKSTLKNCTVRHFKRQWAYYSTGTGKYRRSRRIDIVSDFIPPSMSEFKQGYDEVVGLLRFATGSAMFSTLNDGKIVRGLHGIPEEGPVLLRIQLYLRERQGGSSPEFSLADWLKVMGAVPVTASNLFNLLSAKSHVLLYPGGAREALHNRGEEYKLIWPDQQEFVRMAARFGATIVPFGTVGEDDVAELVLDYNDLMKIPVVNDLIRDANRDLTRLRDKSKGEVANQELYLPGILPKVPGRFYFLFGKPIETKGRAEEILNDRENANQLYLHTKSEVERCIAYLLKKREEDPYRNIVDRTVYRALYSPLHEVPAFDP
ncbi:hypothetical protein OIU84_017921 [Salix udensis]|uniref:Serine aminopeptidase S33 domain-containing protein n=1 Tax=Salix udensis TaxID=889485 RepID=A0AAD6PLH9_9ROSI|nr:hypothetical protein OIU84_017921 [Salix udensis]